MLEERDLIEEEKKGGTRKPMVKEEGGTSNNNEDQGGGDPTFTIDTAQEMLHTLGLEAEAGMEVEAAASAAALRRSGENDVEVDSPAGMLRGGMKIDVLDYYNGRNTGRPMEKWRPGKVREIREDGSIMVHFIGWDSSNDLWLGPVSIVRWQ